MTTTSNPFPYPSVEGAESPWEFLEHLIAERPVAELPDRPGFFLISRYDDVRHALTTPEVFSSRGARAALFGFDALLGGKPEESRLMAEYDPPESTAKRALALTALKPGRLAAYEPLMRGIVDDLIDGFIDRGRCDFVEEFSRPLPARLVVALMGVPDEDYEFIRTWATLEGAGVLFMPEEFQQQQREVGQGMSAYLQERVLERHADPRDDVISEIVRAQVERDGELDLPEVSSIVSALLIGGMVSTGHFLAMLMRLLIDHPDQMAALRRDPGLIPKAVEEGLRMEPPAMWQFRRVAVDTELSGVALPAGSVVLLMLAGANRTPEKFACPHAFDPARENLRNHLAFSIGPHACPGAPMARIEIRIAFERLLARLGDIRLAPGDNLTHVPSPHLRGLNRLEIEFSAIA